MTAYKLIDAQLYADNGDGSYSGVKWCDLKSVTLECKCNEIDKEKLKQLLLGENHYREKPRPDMPSKENITDYIYTLLSSYGKDLSEFEVSVISYKNPINRSLELRIFLINNVSGIERVEVIQVFEYTTPEEIEAMFKESLNALVRKCLDDINKTKFKTNIKKENDIMTPVNYGKFEVIKTQEEIELEEKIAKLRAEYDKKVAKLREEFKAAQEKKARDAKAKELHDKYQSLIDAGFSTEQAYDILQTKMKMDEF